MRIAFVGKGGSGKTTLSVLFSQYVREYKKDKTPILVIDADLNMHLSSLLGFEGLPKEMHISHPIAVKTILNYLRGTNERIKELKHFRKTTPPARGSRFIVLHDPNDFILKQFTIGDNDFKLMVVGTYDSEGIGAMCYHNNLAILENILSHLIDKRGTVVADMVAGVDAFANTLHIQFDMLVLVVEPTKLSISVYNQYQKLANDAGISNSLFVVGNKIRNEADKEFILKHIPNNQVLGFITDSEYLRKNEQEGGLLDINMLEPENKETIEIIANKFFNIQPDYTARLHRLYELHRKYVSQDYIKERFGDLTDQIDESFNFEIFLNEYN